MRLAFSFLQELTPFRAQCHPGTACWTRPHRHCRRDFQQEAGTLSRTLQHSRKASWLGCCPERGLRTPAPQSGKAQRGPPKGCSSGLGPPCHHHQSALLGTVTLGSQGPPPGTAETDSRPGSHLRICSHGASRAPKITPRLDDPLEGLRTQTRGWSFSESCESLGAVLHGAVTFDRESRFSRGDRHLGEVQGNPPKTPVLPSQHTQTIPKSPRNDVGQHPRSAAGRRSSHAWGSREFPEDWTRRHAASMGHTLATRSVYSLRVSN